MVVLNNSTSVLSSIELSYVAALVQNAVLITQSISNFPLTNLLCSFSTSKISQGKRMNNILLNSMDISMHA